MLNQIANERMNVALPDDLRHGRSVPLLCGQGHAAREAGRSQGPAVPRPAELQRDLQALRHRRREYRGAGGLHRARARHGAGLWLAAVGHQRFRLGQADQDADRSRLLQRRRQHPDEQTQIRLADARAAQGDRRRRGLVREGQRALHQPTRRRPRSTCRRSSGIKAVDFGPEFKKTRRGPRTGTT